MSAPVMRVGQAGGATPVAELDIVKVGKGPGGSKWSWLPLAPTEWERSCGWLSCGSEDFFREMGPIGCTCVGGESGRDGHPWLRIFVYLKDGDTYTG